jgi:hypothetical protein
VLNVARATLSGLNDLKKIGEEAAHRGKPPEHLRPFWERKKNA